MLKYYLFFIPDAKEKLKISALRQKIAKEVHSTQALQYPVHMSLISGSFTLKDFLAFEKELKELCKKEKPLALHTDKKTAVLKERFWTGLHIYPVEDIQKLQGKLQTLRNKYADEKEEHPFYPPHITLAFPAQVDDLKPSKSPVSKLVFDRITIVQRNTNSGPYKIYKRIKLGN